MRLSSLARLSAFLYRLQLVRPRIWLWRKSSRAVRGLRLLRFVLALIRAHAQYRGARARNSRQQYTHFVDREHENEVCPTIARNETRPRDTRSKDGGR